MRNTVESSRYSELAFRMLATSLVGVLVLMARPGDVSLVAVCSLIILTIDIRNPVSLKNFFLIYVFLLFGVGAGILHLSTVNVMNDAIYYLAAFLIGYALSTASKSRIMASGEIVPAGVSKARLGRLKQSTVVRAMFVLAGINFLLLLFEFSRYGVVGYYQGQQLIDQFLTYGKANPAGGAEQIIRFGLNYTAIAIVVIYVQSCIEASRRVRYRYPVGLLIVVPILFLHRFDAVVGAATVVGIYSCELRVNSVTRPSAPAGVPHRGRSRNRARGAVVVLGILVTFASALLIGGLRNGVGAPAGSQAPSVGTRGLITEEFTPIQAYGDIKANVRLLGHPRGRTIFLPLVFKVIPRAWYPNKPLNSGAYYMSVVHPAEFAAGFALPPTFFGDALMSFGFIGALAVFLALGAVTARIDTGYKEARRARMPMFLVAFANYYSLMRFPISESLAGILLTLLVWRVANHVFRPRAPVSSGSVVSPGPSLPGEQLGGTRSTPATR